MEKDLVKSQDLEERCKSQEVFAFMKKNGSHLPLLAWIRLWLLGMFALMRSSGLLDMRAKKPKGKGK